MMYNLLKTALTKQGSSIKENKHDITVYDPCCGSGGLLLPFRLCEDDKNLTYTLYGTELNKKMYVLLKCNSIINGLDLNLSFGDCL